MNEKQQIIECLECGNKTNDFYLIPNNRGKLYKCKKCYELSLSRSSRSDHAYKDIHYTSNSMQK